MAHSQFAIARARMGWLLEFAARWLALPKKIRRAAATLGGVECEWVWSGEACSEPRVIVYCHGGAFTVGSLRTHRDIAWRLAVATRTQVLLVHYRLTPAHCFPAAVDDVVAVYEALRAGGTNAQQITLAGDSAGGNLVLAATLRLRDAAAPLPGACVCLSPWVDLTLSGESIRSNARSESLLPVGLLKDAARVYAGAVALSSPLVSPLFGDLSGLPPLWMCAGEHEVLLDDSRRFATRARDAGVQVVFEVWKGQGHAFPLLAFGVPEARQAISQIASFIDSKLFQIGEQERDRLPIAPRTSGDSSLA